MTKQLSEQEGSQGSKEDLELKKKLAAKVNQGADLQHPVKLNEGMADINKGTDAEKNYRGNILENNAMKDDASEDKAAHHAHHADKAAKK